MTEVECAVIEAADAVLDAEPLSDKEDAAVNRLKEAVERMRGER